MSTGCYLLFLLLLLESCGICRDAGRKASLHHFEHALGSVMSSQSWSIAVRWKDFANTFRGTKIWSTRSGAFFSFFLFPRNTHMCLYVYIYMSNVPTCMRGRRRRGREWKLSYLLFLFYFLQQKLLLSPFLAAAVWHYSFYSNNMIVLLANVKLNGCKQWLKDCCTETGDLGHS